mgnify:CR=1 FL=1
MLPTSPDHSPRSVRPSCALAGAFDLLRTLVAGARAKRRGGVGGSDPPRSRGAHVGRGHADVRHEVDAARGDIEDPRHRLVELGAAPLELVPSMESAYDFIGNDGSNFWFYTDHEAPRGRVSWVARQFAAEYRMLFEGVLPWRRSKADGAGPPQG